MTAAPPLSLTYCSEPGPAAAVFEFDGTAAISHGFAGSAGDSFPVGPFTLSFWTKTAAAAGPLFACTAHGGTAPLITLSAPGALTIAYAGGGTVSTAAAIDDDQWHHVMLALVPAGPTLVRVALHIDGNPVYASAGLARPAGSWPDAAATVTLGNSGGGTLAALMSEFELWSGALGSLEAATLFQRRAAAGSPGLVLVWALRDAASSGTIAGGRSNPFVASGLRFRRPPAGQADFATAGWAAQTGATAYDVELWAMDGSWRWSDRATAGDPPVAVPGLLLGRAYRGRVRLIDSSGAGAWGDWTALTPIDLPPVEPAFSWSAWAQPLTAAWVRPDQAQSFLLDNARDPPPSPVPPPQSTTATSEPLTADLEAGDFGWTIDVAAEAVNSIGPLAPAGATTAPAFSFYYVDDGTGAEGSGSFEFDWSGLPAGLSYLACEVRKGNATVLQQVVDLAAAVSPVNFPSPIAVATGDRLTGVMRTIGLGVITHPGSRTVTAQDLARPQLSWTAAASAPESLVQVWSEVSGASGYDVALFQGSATTPVTVLRNQPGLSFDMTSRLAAPGTAGAQAYRLQVRAVVEGEIGPPNLTPAPPVAGSSIRYDWDGVAGSAGTLTIAWTAAQASGPLLYLRLFSGAEPAAPTGFLALPFSAASYAVSAPEGGFAVGAVYSYQAYGLAEGRMAAPEAGLATLHKLDRPAASFTANSANFTLGAHWAAVNPAIPGVLYQVLLNGIASGAPQAGLDFDLTAILQQPAATRFQVEATSDNSFSAPSAATPAPAAAPLLRYNWASDGTDSMSLSWSAAPIAYAQASLQGQQAPAARVLDSSGGTQLAIPGPSGGFVEGQIWSGSVKPIASGTVGATENVSATVHKLAQPQAIWTQASDPSSVKLAWADIRTSDQQGLAVLYQVRLDGASGGTPSSDLEHLFTGLLDQADARIATVQGQADGSYGAASAVPATFAAPATATIVLDLDRNCVIASWPSSAAAAAYYVRLVDSSNNVLGRAWVAVPATPRERYETSFPLTAPAAGTTYTVQVRALAGGGLSAFVAASAVWQNVARPGLGTPTDSAAQHQVTATWSFDPAASGLGATTYVVELHQSDGTLIPPAVSTEQKTATLPYPADTAAGTILKLRVRATTATLLGPWSDYVTLAVDSGLPATSITSFTFDSNNAMRIAWNAVVPAQGGTVTYAVVVTGPGLRNGVFPSQVVGATSLSLDAATTGVANNTAYSATVQPISPAPAGPISASVSATTNILQPPDPGTGNGDTGGDPIAMASGTYSYSYRSLSVAGALPLDFITYYNSYAPLPGPDAPFASDRPLGKRWNHSLNVRLFIPSPQPSSPQVVLLWGSGEANIYDFANQIGLLAKRGRPNGDQLSFNADLSFTLIRKNQKRYDFDRAGRLTRITGAEGNGAVATYDASGRLSRVTDSGTGRFLSFAYYSGGDDDGRLQTVSDNAGRSAGFAYSAGDLVRASNPLGGARGFAYAEGSLMSSATYENGDVIIANEYDGQHRVVRQRDGMSAATGQEMTIGWSTGSDGGFATVIATVAEPGGGTTIYTSLAESQDTIEVLRSIGGGDVSRRRRSYDGVGNLLSETLYEGPSPPPDGTGQTTVYAYDGNSNLIRVDVGAGAAVQTIAYDARNNPTAVSDQLGNVTTISYNSDNTVAETRDALGTRTVYEYQPGPIKGLPSSVSLYPGDGLGGTSNAANATRFTYDSAGQLTTVNEPTGRTLRFAYDAATGWRTGIVVAGADGVALYAETITPLPNGDGRPWQRAVSRYGQPAGQASVTAYSYDSRGNLQSETDPLLRTTTYAYNAGNFLETIVYPAQTGLSERLAIIYTGNNLIDTLTLSAADPLVAWHFGYDGLGRLSRRTDPNGAVTRFAYAMDPNAAAGAAPTAIQVSFPPATAGAAAGQQRSSADVLGRMTALGDIAPAGVAAASTLSAYSIGTDAATGAKTLIVTTTLPPVAEGAAALSEIREYDAYGRQIRFVDAANRTTGVAYSLRQPPGGTTVNIVATITGPLGLQRIVEIDPDGNLTATRRGRPAQGPTAALWESAVLAYDAIGSPVSIVETGPDGTSAPASTYAYGFDPAASQQTVACRPYGGPAYLYRFDIAGQWVSQQAPGGPVETYAYDSRGRLAGWSGGRGQVAYGFDGAGRFTTATWPDGKVVVHDLDAAGNRLVTRVAGATAITRTFDALNRIATRTDSASGETVGWTWTPMNRVASIAYPGVATPVTYGYDGLQRLTSVTDWNARTTGYVYSPTSRLLTANLPVGLTTTNSFDPADRLTGFTAAAGAQIVASASYTLDALGRPTDADQVLPLAPGPAQPLQMSYDGDRLIAVGGASVAYDPAGAMTQAPGVSGTMIYDALGQLTGAGGNVYGYDPDGLLVSAAINGTGSRLTVDPGGYRAPRVEQADPTRAVTGSGLASPPGGAYGPLPTPPAFTLAAPIGLNLPRPATLGPDQPDPFLALPLPGVRQPMAGNLDRVLAITPAAGGAGRVRYVHGLGLIGREDGDGWKTCVSDPTGNVLAWLDSSGEITDRYAYGPFGEPAGSLGATKDPFRQLGYYGAASFGDGLTAMRFRRFAPGLLRFTARDILAGDPVRPQTWNRYAFLSGNPLQRIDPLGLSDDDDDDDDDDSGGGGGGEIAGIVIGVVAGVAAVGTAAGVGLSYVYGSSVPGYSIFSRIGARLGINFARAGAYSVVGSAESVAESVAASAAEEVEMAPRPRPYDPFHLD